MGYFHDCATALWCPWWWCHNSVCVCFFLCPDFSKWFHFVFIRKIKSKEDMMMYFKIWNTVKYINITYWLELRSHTA